MNILSRLPFLKSGNDDIDAQAAEIQAKADRIQYHRDHVRNGPVKLRDISNGQVRRMQKRALATKARKARNRQVRSYQAQQHEAATLRGHLQGVAIVPYVSPLTKITFEQAERSLNWIIRRYVKTTGRPVLESNDLVLALTSALNRYQALVGEPVTPLSPAYTLPITLGGDVTEDVPA